MKPYIIRFINHRGLTWVMAKFGIFISIVMLIAALVILFSKLFTPQPIQITLESGQEVTTSSAEYFSLSETLLLIVSAFAVGTAATYLYYNSDRGRIQQKPIPSGRVYESIMPLLKEQEKQAIHAIREAGGEMQQNKLVVKLGVSKVKATRILFGLAQKGLIIKERHGLTNMVKLEKKLSEH
jgi:uncharacterized membrane protein